MDNPETVGEIQVLIEATREHINTLWGLLDNIGQVPNRQHYTPNGTQNMSPGTIEYHFAVVEEYILACQSGLVSIAGPTNGQLCPYADCAYDLAFESAGWWRCPNCQRFFFAMESDSDFELYHNYRHNSVSAPPMPKERIIPHARSLGPSWASPK